MEITEIVLGTAILLCSLVSGMILVFAIVVMPGLATLENREFLKSFKVIDGVIQDNQPIFLLVWAGSVLSLVVLTILGFMYLDGYRFWLVIGATMLYISELNYLRL